MEERKKGFHPLYFWSIFFVVIIYISPVLFFVAVDNSDANGQVTKYGNGLGFVPWLFLLMPLILLVINVLIAIVLRNIERRILLNAARIIKYSLIPFFILGSFVLVVNTLLIFTPVIIWMFVGPVIDMILIVSGWFTMVGSAPLVIAYLIKSKKDGKYNNSFVILVIAMQFFFVIDVVGTIICAIKERK